MFSATPLEMISRILSTLLAWIGAFEHKSLHFKLADYESHMGVFVAENMPAIRLLDALEKLLYDVHVSDGRLNALPTDATEPL